MQTYPQVSHACKRLNQILTNGITIQIFQKDEPNMMLHLVMEQWEELIDWVEQKRQESLNKKDLELCMVDRLLRAQTLIECLISLSLCKIESLSTESSIFKDNNNLI